MRHTTDPRPIPAVGVVVTAFNQGRYVSDAIESVLAQTHAPAEVVLVDDGSTDAGSLAVLDEWSRHPDVAVVRRANGGVSAARNSGVAALGTEFVAVLDGDDAFEPAFIEHTLSEFEDPSVVGASSWLRMHGVATAIARPLGGTAADFLSRNAAPAAALFRREDWLRAGGYTEAMREGFEDWDFFLSLLALGGRIAVVPEPLLRYRTAAGSANLRSMDRRSELYGRIIDRHRALFDTHLRTTLIALDADRARRRSRAMDDGMGARGRRAARRRAHGCLLRRRRHGRDRPGRDPATHLTGVRRGRHPPSPRQWWKCDPLAASSGSGAVSASR